MRRQLGGESSTDPWYDWVPLMHALSMRTAGQFDVPRSWISVEVRKIKSPTPAHGSLSDDLGGDPSASTR